MLSRNARHSWEAGNPLVELVRFVSKGSSVHGASQSWLLVASARMSARLSQGTVRGQMCGPGVPSFNAPDVPHGREAILPGPQNQGDGPVELIHFGRSLFLRQSVESG